MLKHPPSSQKSLACPGASTPEASFAALTVLKHIRRVNQ